VIVPVEAEPGGHARFRSGGSGPVSSVGVKLAAPTCTTASLIAGVDLGRPSRRAVDALEAFGLLDAEDALSYARPPTGRNIRSNHCRRRTTIEDRKRRCAAVPTSPNRKILRAQTEHLATMPACSLDSAWRRSINCVGISVIARASSKGETGCASYGSGESCLPICRVVLPFNQAGCGGGIAPCFAPGDRAETASRRTFETKSTSNERSIFR
jgi:hypothetical protein